MSENPYTILENSGSESRLEMKGIVSGGAELYSRLQDIEKVAKGPIQSELYIFI